MRIKVGSREIGDGCPTFIIAEVGSNWRTLEDCKNSIHMAKQCGADAVKFQAFDYASLYGPNPHHNHSLPVAGQLPLEWLPILKEKADLCGIEFMCSAFSPELIEAVNPFVNIHKLASAEMTHVRMLERLRDIGKPVIMSTGAHGEADIGMALSALNETPTVLLYCVAAYPANEVNLGCIQSLNDTFGVPVGYSDHSTDVLVIPRRATELGACVIEKHVTFIEAVTPDSPHSLSADQFKRMVQSIRGDRGSSPGASSEEKPMILRHNRRLLATADITVGETLQEGVNFGIYRSLKDDTHAFSPFMVDAVNGCVAMRDIIAGNGIGPGDV